MAEQAENEQFEDNYLSNLHYDLAEESDSELEDEGDLIRTGNVPQQWYEKELHDGYDIDGNKVFARGLGDHIDQFLLAKRQSATDLKRTIYDMKNDKMVKLTERDLSIINRLRRGKSCKMYDPGLPETVVFDITTSGIQPKSRFTISKSDHRQILQYVQSIKTGKLKVDKHGEVVKSKKERKRAEIQRMDLYRVNQSSVTKQYDVWKRNMQIQARQIIRAPKSRLPTNYESYNPSNEYLLSEREKQRLQAIPDTQRNGRILPLKYDCLRHVPQYDRFIHERFERCLDLYLLPRKVSTKFVVNPKDLLPKLPSIEDLKPFPEILSNEYYGHAQSVRCIDISSCGQWLASASDDGTVRIFEIESGREFYRHSFGKGDRIEAVQFNPKQNRQSLLSVICRHRCFLIPISFLSSSADHQQYVIAPIVKMKGKSSSGESQAEQDQMVLPRLNLKQTMALFKQNLLEELSHWPSLIETMSNEMNWSIHDKFKEIAQQIEAYQQQKQEKQNENDEQDNDDMDGDAEPIELNTNDISIAARWSFLTLHSNKSNTIIASYNLINNNVVCISMLSYLSGIAWHAGGDYFATYREEKERAALIIHRFSKFESQIPFSKAIGEIQSVKWHPRKPLIYVACKQSIRCFNLERCKLYEKYKIATSWITAFDLHASALNMIVGGIDGKVSWYDMDLSHSPYKTFNFHSNVCVRNVQYHRHHKYSHLWATCGDDGKIFVFYCRMFRDKFADPILIPLNILKVHKHRVLDIKWHKTLPWIFASCSDGVIRRFSPL